MILRNAAVRYGRNAVPAPVTRSWRRALSTETITSKPAPSTMPAYKLAAQKLIDSKNNAIPEEFRIARTLRNKTKAVGSELEMEYFPHELISNPPSEATLELLMASQAHLGHNVALWNPVNARYIYGERQGIHIISLEQTMSHLKRAARVVEEVAYYGGLILFAGTRRNYTDIVVRAAQLSGGCHLFQKWTPGSITNRDTILRSSAIRVVDENDETIPGFDRHVQERRPLIPDLVVCLNPVENYTMLYECGLESVPTIGIIDTNADPSWVTYPIPGNDDSLRAAALIAGILGRAGQRGRRRRLKDAESGLVTWENPPEVDHFIQQDAARKADQIAKTAEMEIAQKKSYN